VKQETQKNELYPVINHEENKIPLLILFSQNFPTITIFKTSSSVTILKNFPQYDNFSKNPPPPHGGVRRRFCTSALLVQENCPEGSIDTKFIM
jgi:hypothetical protein